MGQRGIQDLNTYFPDLKSVIPPSNGYSTTKVDIVQDHTYVALAETGEEGYYVIFNVTSHNDDLNTLTISYLYKYFN